jgi:hypothetical protein
MAKSAAGTALMAQSNGALQAAVKQYYPNTHKVKIHRSHPGAYAQGQEAGKSVHFSKGIGAGTRQKAIR